MASPFIPMAPKARAGGKSTHGSSPKPPAPYSSFWLFIGDLIGLLSLIGMLVAGLFAALVFGGQI